MPVGTQPTHHRASEALARNNASMRRIMTLLEQNGIADEHISTSGFSVSPTRERRSSSDAGELVFVVSNRLRVRSSDDRSLLD